MNTTIQTSDAVKLFRKADCLKLECGEAEWWTAIEEDLSDYQDDDMVFSISTENEVYTFRFEFSKKNLLEATVEDNCITLNDIEGEQIKINCYKMSPCFLNKK